MTKTTLCPLIDESRLEITTSYKQQIGRKDLTKDKKCIKFVIFNTLLALQKLQN